MEALIKLTSLQSLILFRMMRDSVAANTASYAASWLDSDRESCHTVLKRPHSTLIFLQVTFCLSPYLHFLSMVCDLYAFNKEWLLLATDIRYDACDEPVVIQGVELELEISKHKMKSQGFPDTETNHLNLLQTL